MSCKFSLEQNIVFILYVPYKYYRHWVLLIWGTNRLDKKKLLRMSVFVCAKRSTGNGSWLPNVIFKFLAK